MLARLFPSPSNFAYTGSRVSLWLLGLVLLLKLAIALGGIFNGHYAASVADGIPLTHTHRKEHKPSSRSLPPWVYLSS